MVCDYIPPPPTAATTTRFKQGAGTTGVNAVATNEAGFPSAFVRPSNATEIVQLDLSQNRIESAGGLSCLPSLHTLNLAKNALGDAGAVSPLSECPSLTNLDVTGNRLAGPGVLDVRHIELAKLSRD